MDALSQKARIKSLKRKTKGCPEKDYCAGLHYELAMAYLSRSVPNRKALDTAALHLKKAAQDERFKEPALLLHKVLRGWIRETDQRTKSERRAKELKASLEQAETRLKGAKAIDLKMINEE